MSAASGEPRRRRSGALFNNRHFADVAAAALAVSQDGVNVFTTRMVASSTGLADSVVRPVLHRLVDAHVLTRLPRVGGGRSAQYFQALEVDALATIRQLAEPAVGDEPINASAPASSDRPR